MNQRVHTLISQIEAAAAEKLQRETENLQLEQQAADYDAERMPVRRGRACCNLKKINCAPA